MSSSYQQERNERQLAEELRMRQVLQEKGGNPEKLKQMTYEQLKAALEPEKKIP